MHWLCEMTGFGPLYEANFDVRCYFKAIIERYTKGNDQRLPTELAHILNHVKSLKRCKKIK